mgnify:FL=1
MTKVVGLTGGIGGGKTTVSQMFKTLGVPVFNSDEEAKMLMNNSKVIKQNINQLLGEESYRNGILNKQYIAKKVFNNKPLLKELNAIVHPVVAATFDRWVSTQTAPYVIKEIAILFETKSQSLFDFIITVTAPLDRRIQRVINRDLKSKKDVEIIIENQLPDSEKINNSHYVIENLTRLTTEKNVLEIHNKILDKIIET